MDYSQKFFNLIETVIRENASDLHITVGRHPSIRIAGELIMLTKEDVITPESAEGLAAVILSPDDAKRFAESYELDFSYSYQSKARFRVNVFRQRGMAGVALRVVPAKIRTLEELNLPPILLDFARKEQGFFLVVGPTGHGKTTTLAALVDFINHERAEHIITVEDPIEYLFNSDRSIMDQREVRTDTVSFAAALRSLFREDVNVAMIGEMRDYETMATAVTAAETGHLVFSSLHTNNASQTVDRIIDSFPAGQQNQIRAQLSNSLLGVFSQRLLPRQSGGRIPAYELMIVNSAVRNLIRENKIHEIDLVIDTSSREGMVSLNRSLLDLVRKGEVSMEVAASYSLNPQEFQLLAR